MYGIEEARRDASRHRLSKVEEVKLHAAYMSGDHAAGQRLVNSFLPALCHSARARMMPKEHKPDLIGVAAQAFLSNLFRWDPARDCRLWSYMHVAVAHDLSLYALANRTFFRVVSPKDRTALTHLESEKKKIGASGRTLTGSEARRIGDLFGLPESIIHALDDDMSVMRPDPIQNDRNAERHGMDDPEREGSHLDFERRHDHDRHMTLLTTGLDLLDARQREIVDRRFKDSPDTLEDIARDMGVSRERIRQIEMTALRILRHSIENPDHGRPKHTWLQRRYNQKRNDPSRRNVSSAASTKQPKRRASNRRRRTNTPAPKPRTDQPLAMKDAV